MSASVLNREKINKTIILSLNEKTFGQLIYIVILISVTSLKCVKSVYTHDLIITFCILFSKNSIYLD
jgi:hypothetical protein